MKNLMMLPWLAHRSGISDAHAEELWAEAIRYATMKSEWVGTPEFWKVAVDNLLERIDAVKPVPQGRSNTTVRSRSPKPAVLARPAAARQICTTCCTIC